MEKPSDNVSKSLMRRALCFLSLPIHICIIVCPDSTVRRQLGIRSYDNGMAQPVSLIMGNGPGYAAGYPADRYGNIREQSAVIDTADASWLVVSQQIVDDHAPFLLR